MLRTALVFATAFGVSQAIMPLLGWLLGSTFADAIAPWDHWISFGLLALVGGKNAGIKGGRYIRYPADTPLANLHVTILEKLGVPVEALGDSTGQLDRLTV